MRLGRERYIFKSQGKSIKSQGSIVKSQGKSKKSQGSIMKSQGKSKKSQGEIYGLIGGSVYYNIKREVSASLFLFESLKQ